MTELNRLWLVEALHLQETLAGPLEDSEAVRRARHAGGTLGVRLETRALWLAEQNGLANALNRWHRGARLGLLVLVLLAVLSGISMAVAAVGDGSRPVNVFWALGSLLGLNLLSLLAWAVTSLIQRQPPALGRAWLWLSERLARDAQAIHLGPALLALLGRRRLGRWLLGSTVHALWALSAASALVTLLLMLATRRYGFVWETTLLSSDTFVALTHALGQLPATLGFAVPSSEAVRASGEAAVASARQPWATWLLGVLLCYGLLPRALLAALCVWRWRHGRQQLLAAPGYPVSEALRERLLPSHEPLGVVDAEHPQALPGRAVQPVVAQMPALVLGLELADGPPWPLPLPPGVHDGGLLDDRASRERLLEHLTRQPPARLLVACDPRRSPDRGTLALLGELSRSAAGMRIWLLPTAAEPARLHSWQAALDTAGWVHTPTFPQQWLEGHDG